MAADLDKPRAQFVDAVLAHDQAWKLVRQAARPRRRKRLAGEIGELAALPRRQNEAVVADRLPRVERADVGAGVDRRQHVERADQGDVGVAREQHAHGIGIAGDVDVLDLETVHPSLLLGDQIRQRKRRDRSGKDHLDLGGDGDGRIGNQSDGKAEG